MGILHKTLKDAQTEIRKGNRKKALEILMQCYQEEEPFQPQVAMLENKLKEFRGKVSIAIESVKSEENADGVLGKITDAIYQLEEIKGYLKTMLKETIKIE